MTEMNVVHRPEEPALVRTRIDPKVLEQVLVGGDLSQLVPAERLNYYRAVCDSVGLNPLTKPFEYLQLDNRLVLYARKDCTDQLRKNRRVNITIVGRELVGDIYVVTARATLPDGRQDESVGAVPFKRENGEWKTAQNGKRYFQGNGHYVELRPEDKANAVMKCETKAKRRVTLSICGLGIIDESEIETIEGAEIVPVDSNGVLPPLPSQPPEPPPAAAPENGGMSPRDKLIRERMRTKEDTEFFLNELHDKCKELMGVEAGSKAFAEALRANGVDSMSKFKNMGEMRDAAFDIHKRVENIRQSLKPKGDEPLFSQEESHD